MKKQKERNRTKQLAVARFVTVPSFINSSPTVSAVLPWLYLHDVPANKMVATLSLVLGKQHLSELNTEYVSSLKQRWIQEFLAWRKRPLYSRQYVYLWADGIRCRLQGERELQHILVLAGVTDKGIKNYIAIETGRRESKSAWRKLLVDLKQRGMSKTRLAVGDGALGIWEALAEMFPTTAVQHCWARKNATVASGVAKAELAGIRVYLQKIMMAPSRKEALKAAANFERELEARHLRAVETFRKDFDKMLSYYNFPAEHWGSLRTTKPIESTFSTFRRECFKTRERVSHLEMQALIYKLAMSAQETWRKMLGYSLLPQVDSGKDFKDGELMTSSGLLPFATGAVRETFH